MIAAVLSILVVILAYDEKLQPAGDLLPRRPVPKPEENGLVLLRELWGKTPEPDTADLARWDKVLSNLEPWDEGLIQRLTEGGGTLRANADRALALPGWQFPLENIKETAPELNRLMMSRTRVMQANILRAWRSGEYGEALAGMETLSRLCRRNTAGATNMLFAMVASSQAGMSIKPALWIAASPQTAEDFIWTRMQAIYLEPTVGAGDVDEVMRWEFRLNETFTKKEESSGDVEPREDGAFLANLLHKRNLTLNRVATTYRSANAMWLKPADSFETSFWNLHHRDLNEPPAWPEMLHPNASGLRVLKTFHESCALLNYSAQRQLTHWRLAAVRIALRRWEPRHDGQLPGKLEELIPDFLQEIPEDPFDGKPLRWEPEEGIIYSLGRNWCEEPPNVNVETTGLLEDRGVRVLSLSHD